MNSNATNAAMLSALIAQQEKLRTICSELSLSLELARLSASALDQELQRVKGVLSGIGVKDVPRMPIFLGFRDKDDM